MTTIAKKYLTEPYIKGLKASETKARYAVADTQVPGLKVLVSRTGHKSFVLWRRVDPSASSASALALGPVGQLTLKEAREKARRWVEIIKSGRDPRGEGQADSFAVVLETYFEKHVKRQRRAEKVQREMRAELLSRWRRKSVRDITRRDVIQMIDEIKDRGAPAQARNILGHAKTFFAWCVEKGIVELSPADAIKPHRLIGPKATRLRVLSDEEIAAFWKATGELGYPIGSLFRLLLLTGQRRSEVSGARWREFDLPNKVWTVPPERFKSNSSHIVPLSGAAMSLLEALPRWNAGDYLFSTDGRKPVNGFSGAKADLDAKMSVEAPWVTHDLRRTVRTRLASLKVADVTAEQIIGHGRRGLQRVYDQHQYVDEMREGLELWAARLRILVS